MKTYAQVNKATGYCGAVVSTTGILESSDTVEMILLEEGDYSSGQGLTAKPRPIQTRAAGLTAIRYGFDTEFRRR